MELANAVGYVRVSTAEQAHNSEALSNQRARVAAALPPGAPIFEDICSGTKTSRPGFDQMLEVLKSGRYTHVVITRVDRLGRNQRTGFQQIIDWHVGKSGPPVKTVALDVPINLDELGGRFNLAMMSEMAIFEVDMLSTRVRRSIEHTMLKQEFRSTPPFGYISVNGKFVVDDEKRHCPLGVKPTDPEEEYEGISNADLMRLLISTYVETGSPQRTIELLNPYALTQTDRKGRACGNPTTGFTVDGKIIRLHLRPGFPGSRSTACDRIWNVAYRGHRGHRKNWDENKRPANGEARNDSCNKKSLNHYQILHENTHEPLITTEQFQKLLVIEERHQKYTSAGSKFKAAGSASKIRGTAGSPLSVHPLSGLLHCSGCNRPLAFNRGRAMKYAYYRCRTTGCPQERIAIRNDRAAIAIAIQLQQKAARIQSGEEQLPRLKTNQESERISLQASLEYLMGAPDPSIVSKQIQEVRRKIEVLDGEGLGDHFIAGSARQLLLSPKAADLAHWAKFIQDPENLVYRLPLLIESAVVGYAKEEDRPQVVTSKAKGGGLRERKVQGKASVLSVELR